MKPTITKMKVKTKTGGEFVMQISAEVAKDLLVARLQEMALAFHERHGGRPFNICDSQVCEKNHEALEWGKGDWI